jgi:hypothetical protein
VFGIVPLSTKITNSPLKPLVKRAPLGGIETGGYHLTYVDQMSRAKELRKKFVQISACVDGTSRKPFTEMTHERDKIGSVTFDDSLTVTPTPCASYRARADGSMTPKESLSG